jgi:hypothetical protein
MNTNDDAPAWTLTNEFAQVRVCLDRQGNDTRLLILDLRNDLTIALDAFQLAALTGLTAEQLAAFMDPNRALPT